MKKKQDIIHKILTAGYLWVMGLLLSQAIPLGNLSKFGVSWKLWGRSQAQGKAQYLGIGKSSQGDLLVVGRRKWRRALVLEFISSKHFSTLVSLPSRFRIILGEETPIGLDWLMWSFLASGAWDAWWLMGVGVLTKEIRGGGRKSKAADDPYGSWILFFCSSVVSKFFATNF